MVTITLSAPGKNALSVELMGWLLGELRAAAGAPVLLTGEGGVFSAGLNLRELAGCDAGGVARLVGRLEELAEALYTYPGPTVAAMPGHAIAGGCVLALACDRRVLIDDERVRVGVTGVAYGMRFPPVTWRLLRDRVPRSSQEEVLLGAGLFAPARALALGLVDELAVDPLATARARLAALSALDAGAYAATKRLMRVGVLAVPEEERRRFEQEDLPVWSSSELRERALARFNSAPRVAPE